MGHESIEGELGSCLKMIRVETQTTTRLVVTGNFVFPEEYCGFEGHFPGNPILPAIAQLAAVRFLAESVLKSSLLPASLSKVKFKGMVQPGEDIVVHLQLQGGDGSWQGGFTLLRDAGELLTSGNIILNMNE